MTPEISNSTFIRCLSCGGDAGFIEHPYADAECRTCGLVCLDVCRDAEGRVFEAVTAELLWERRRAYERARITALLEDDACFDHEAVTLQFRALADDTLSR